MKQRNLAFLLACIIMFSGCAVPASSKTLGATPNSEPKTYLNIQTPRYILVGLGKFSITPNIPYPVKSIVSAENVEAKITDYRFPEDQIDKYNYFKYHDMKNYTYIDLYFKMEDGRRYNNKYGVTTMEYQGDIKTEPIPEELNFPPDPKAEQGKSVMIGIRPLQNVVIVHDFYNGTSNGYSFEQANTESEDTARIEQTINQALDDCYLTFSNTLEFKEAVQEIEKGLKSKKQKDVAKGIYDWITANITYDEEKVKNNYFESNAISEISAAKALEDRKTICTGFAYLYNALARHFGLKSYVIMGVGKKYEHAWNAIQLEDGSELAIDCTFGSHEPDRFFVSAPDKYFTEYHQIWSNKEGKYIPFTDFSSYVLAD